MYRARARMVLVEDVFSTVFCNRIDETLFCFVLFCFCFFYEVKPPLLANLAANGTTEILGEKATRHYFGF